MSGKSKIEKQEFVKLYVPELMQLMDGGDEKSCLMMAQLEYWFGLKPDSFYKFMTPAKVEESGYTKGDSWIEEMGMSKNKIDNALKPICTHYKSFTEYKNEADKFKGKYYASYYHKPSHKTYYLRNHELTNKALASLELERKSVIFRAKHSSKIEKSNYHVSGNGEKQSLGNVENPSSESKGFEVVYTENNAKTTTKREKNSLSDIKVNQTNGDFDYIESDDVTTKERVSKSARKNKTPFPENFELTDEMISWAESKNPGINVQNSTDKFIVLNKGQLKEDWDVAWRLWILREEVKKSVASTSWDERRETYGSIRGMFDDIED